MPIVEWLSIASISDVALLYKLKNSAQWMGFLLAQYLKDRTNLNLTSAKGIRIRIADAMSITRPGSKGSDWILHTGFDLEHLCCDHLALTGPDCGESLARFTLKPGDVAMGDRAYGNRKGVFAAVRAGADVLVRLAINHMPMLHMDGTAVDVLDELKTLKPGETLDIPVLTVPMRNASDNRP